MRKDMDEIFNIVFDKMSVYGGEGWFIDLNYSILFKMNLQLEMITFESCLPIYRGIRYQYRRMVVYGDSLIMIPYNADRILIYNIPNKAYQEILLDETYSNNNMQMVFSNAYVAGNKIVFIPARYRAVVCLNMERCELEYSTSLMEQICKISLNKNRHFFSGEYICVKNSLYVPLWQNNYIAELEIDNLNGKLLQLDNNQDGLHSICGNNDRLIVSVKGKMQFKELKFAGAEVRDLEFDVGDFTTKSGVCGMMESGDGYMIVPSKGNTIYWWNPDSGETKVVYKTAFEYADNIKKYAYADLSFVGFEKFQDKLYIYSQYEGSLLVINMRDFSVHAISMAYPWEHHCKEQMKKIIFSQSDAIMEKELIDLQVFVETIVLEK